MGDLRFNPLKDPVTAPNGKRVMLAPPEAPELPSRGFAQGAAGYLSPKPLSQRRQLQVVISPTSERLQRLEPFPTWDGRDFERLPILLKAKGQCTTDHISPAGKWLRYRGHLDKISDNTFSTAINAFTTQPGTGVDSLDGQTKPLPQIARHYKSQGLGWVAIGDVNYGEGPSREHAAMSPRLLGAAAVITRSFARIHAANLKKQGILPLTFADPKDYEKVQETDRVSILGLKGLTPGKPLAGILHHADGKEDKVTLNHTLNAEQILWFKAGSALNKLREQAKA